MFQNCKFILVMKTMPKLLWNIQWEREAYAILTAMESEKNSKVVGAKRTGKKKRRSLIFNGAKTKVESSGVRTMVGKIWDRIVLEENKLQK